MLFLPAPALVLGACTLISSIDDLGPGPGPLQDPDALRSGPDQPAEGADAGALSDADAPAPEQPVPPTNLVTNPGFESGSGGWLAFGSAFLGAVTDSPHAGARCLKTSGRTDTFEGPSYRLIASTASGKIYSASGWVRTDGDAHGIALSTKITCAGEDPAYAQIAGRIATDVWTELASSFLVPECQLDEIRIYFEGPPAGVDFYVDDVSVTDATP